MTASGNPLLRSLPAIDELLRLPDGQRLVATYGREFATEGLRDATTDARRRLTADGTTALAAVEPAALLNDAERRLRALSAPSLKPVFNLTGTVLHTNLGRAPLPQAAIDALTAVAGGASNLEFDLASGTRGDRDSHVEDWICRLTGAEAATVVNNNAAAVLLLLNTLALRREVIVSRGELVEIGGAFRVPDVMSRAGAKLVAVSYTHLTLPTNREV